MQAGINDVMTSISRPDWECDPGLRALDRSLAFFASTEEAQIREALKDLEGRGREASQECSRRRSITRE
ncbi:MAG: hypothetical protein L0170_11510 [Acidobacteria bacterium]|nr:hypothetical protein [Acidobacteriota bacterium]